MEGLMISKKEVEVKSLLDSYLEKRAKDRTSKHTYLANPSGLAR